MTATAPDLAAEYAALTERCGIVDRSERGKLWLHGAEAKEFLQGQVTNDVEGLEPGGGCYAAFLTHKGKMLGDLRVLDCGDGLWLDTERSALQELFNMIRRFKIGRSVELEKRTLERGLLSLVGPRTDELVALPEGEEHAHARAEVAGIPVRVAVTDAGADLICDSARTAELRDALVAAGATPVSEAATEIVRVERGRPRWGAELDATVIPQEAGLNDRAVSFTKGCYVGQETVARLFYKGKPNRHLRGLRFRADATGRAADAALPAHRDPLRLGEKVVGAVGTAVLSPRLGQIGLAIVRREAAPGDILAVGDGGTTAEVVGLPF